MNDVRPQRDERSAATASWQTPTNPWLNGYAAVVAASILVLICSGGLVTSKGVGLAVPDWPNTFGYNVFAFPISRWVGGILFEHVHRLIASVVGFLTVGLTAWLCWAEPRRWVRNLGIAALAAVIIQAVLGGLRVVELKDVLGLFHACLAQAFLTLVALIALVTSQWWQRLRQPSKSVAATFSWRVLLRAFALIAVLIYGQLALGATMRHAHAGLSILDFPTAYGQAWPHIDAARLAQINRQRDEVLHLPPTTLAQIEIQMAHRVIAGVIFLAVLAAAVLTWQRRTALPAALCRLALAGPVLIACQIGLGVATIWTNKAADIATAHVAVGAISLVWSVLTYAALRRWTTPASFASVAVGNAAAAPRSQSRVEVGV